jgi:hypothetical protein
MEIIQTTIGQCMGWRLFFVRPPSAGASSGQPNSPERQLHQQSDFLYFQKANRFEIKVKRARERRCRNCSRARRQNETRVF